MLDLLTFSFLVKVQFIVILLYCFQLFNTFSLLYSIIMYPRKGCKMTIWYLEIKFFLIFLHFFPEYGILLFIPKIFKEVFDVSRQRRKRRAVACPYQEACQNSGQPKCQHMKSSLKGIPYCFVSGDTCHCLLDGFCFAEHPFNCQHAGPKGWQLPCFHKKCHSRK